MQMTVLRCKFSCSWLGLWIYLLFLILLCSLGFWQLSRAEQKTRFLQQQKIAATAPPVHLNQVSVDVQSSRYQKVLVTGRYDEEHQFLLDNQILDGKPGYFVLTPLRMEAGKTAVLVNRGWQALGKDRKILPDVHIDKPEQSISGRINEFPQVGIKLKGAEIPTESWPSVVQVIDTKVLAARLGYALSDYQIELDAENVEGYQRQWKITTSIPPEKHRAYAVQWFGLALTLTVLFIWISTKKRSE